MYDLGLRLPSSLQFRAFSVSLSFDGRLSSASSTCFPVASELALSACTYGLRFGDRFRLQFLSALRFRVIRFARRCCVSACVQSDSTLPFSSAWLTCVKSLRYGCLSLSITSVPLQADSMLTARIGHSMFDCDSSISPSTLRLPFGYFLRIPARISFAACHRFRLHFRSAIALLATRGFPACISRRPCGFEFIGFAGRMCFSTCAFVRQLCVRYRMPSQRSRFVCLRIPFQPCVISLYI
jgi:hypothetical protein